METKIRVEGIYDTRTLKFLQGEGIKNFGFNFCPKSFNFIQEHVFLEQIVPLLGPLDKLDLTFTRSNDPMLAKVLLDLKKVGYDTNNVSIICEEWPILPSEINHRFYLNYSTLSNSEDSNSPFFQGFIFAFPFFQEIHEKKLFTTFITDFFARYGRTTHGKELVLSRGWKDNVFPSLMDKFDFDVISFSINADIETCYRNVDIKRLGKELSIQLPGYEF